MGPTPCRLVLETMDQGICCINAETAQMNKVKGNFAPRDLITDDNAPWSSRLMGCTAETLPESKGLVHSVKHHSNNFQQDGCSWRKLTESIHTSEWQTDTYVHSYDPAWTLWDHTTWTVDFSNFDKCMVWLIYVLYYASIVGLSFGNCYSTSR